MKASVERLRIDHIVAIQQREEDLIVGRACGLDKVKAGENYLRRGPGIALVVDEAVAMVGGVAELGGATWEAWLMTSKLVEPYRFSFHRAVVRFLNEQLERPGVLKLVAAVHRENPRARRWIEALGFTEEGRMMGKGGLVFVKYGRLKSRAAGHKPPGGARPRLRGLPASPTHDRLR
uniref:Acetyltransferase n=1 Tax=viral metagenome TaxID=1070528 RepID=A0A6M3J095_9ZZZZ